MIICGGQRTYCQLFASETFTCVLASKLRPPNLSILYLLSYPTGPQIFTAHFNAMFGQLFIVLFIDWLFSVLCPLRSLANNPDRCEAGRFCLP